MIDFGVGVILPAAGSGERVSPDKKTPKQYFSILGKPLFQHALDAFTQMPWVKKIVLVVDNPDHVEGFLTKSNLYQEKVLVVRGEQTRHRSIRAGLETLQKNEIGSCLHVVVVHDAVRPFVPASLVEELILAAQQHGAAGTIRPLVSTVIEKQDDGFLGQVLDRKKYVASETPQAFKFAVLSRAYNKCSEEDLDNGTECLQLTLAYSGIKARLIEGPSDMWKVTYKKDIYAAMGCLKEKNTQVCIIASMESDAVRLLAEMLRSRVSRVECYTSDTIYNEVKDQYTSVIFFHVRDIDREIRLQKIFAKLDTDKQGLIVYVTELGAEGVQDVASCDLRNIASQCKTLQKGVVVINRRTPGEDKHLADLVTSLVLSDAYTFSGQTFVL